MDRLSLLVMPIAYQSELNLHKQMFILTGPAISITRVRWNPFECDGASAENVNPEMLIDCSV